MQTGKAMIDESPLAPFKEARRHRTARRGISWRQQKKPKMWQCFFWKWTIYDKLFLHLPFSHLSKHWSNIIWKWEICARYEPLSNLILRDESERLWHVTIQLTASYRLTVGNTYYYFYSFLNYFSFKSWAYTMTELWKSFHYDIRAHLRVCSSPVCVLLRLLLTRFTLWIINVIMTHIQ